MTHDRPDPGSITIIKAELSNSDQSEDFMDGKTMAMALGAALMFTLGGVFMKPAEGLTRLAPTCGVLVLFLIGAALNALIVHRGGELGVAYLLVVGCETLLAFALGTLIYNERVTTVRLIAVGLIGCGALLLAATESGQASPASVEAMVVPH